LFQDSEEEEEHGDELERQLREKALMSMNRGKHSEPDMEQSNDSSD